MPKVYRAMKEENGGPQTGQASSALGVRVGLDITPDADGFAAPKTGGMSVAPSLEALPPGMIPKRLKYLLIDGEGAKGSNTLRIWTTGTGAFQDSALTAKLTLRVDKPTHGLVEPFAVMPLSEYENAIYNTRDAWKIEEEKTQL